ncbi:MAG: BTAD domain-containing putative transcriptional regulator [Actinomycetota bacterium]
MDLRLLGPVEIRTDGDPIDLGGPRQRALLAALALEPGSALSIDRLTEILWVDALPVRADRSIQTYISRLRKAIGAERIETSSAGYRLLLGPDERDIDRFIGAVHRARELRRLGDLSGAARFYVAAEGAWTGDPLAEVADRAWAVPTITSLNELRASAREEHAETLLDLDEPTAAAELIVQLVADDPLRESTRRLQLLALHRTGRTVEAAREYQRFRTLLIDETGLEPTAALAELEQRIVQGDQDVARPRLVARGFELMEQIGTGPGGPIWRARSQGLGHEVALEVVRAELADDPEVIRTFERRAQEVIALASPDVETVLDAWRDHAGAYVVTRLPARRIVADEDAPPAVPDALAGALAALHTAGLVLARLSIDDLFVDQDGSVRLGGVVVPPAASRSPTDDVADALDVLASLGASDSDALRHLADSPPADGVALQAALGIGGMDGQERRNPYKGLEAFDLTDVHDFFGRKDVQAELADRIAQQRLIAVVGPSGSGKSSVVRAGLVPQLIERSEMIDRPLYVVTIVPGADPFETLEAGLLRIAVNPPADLGARLTEDDRGLRRALARCLPDPSGELVLVIDQFEEIYTLGTEERAARFVRSLVTAATAEDSQLRCVLTIRADFYDRPLGDPDLGELLAAGTVPLPALTADQLEEIVIGPARQVGLGIEPTVVAELVRTGLTEPGSLPLVEFTLTELAAHAAGESISGRDLDSVGGVSGSIGRRAEDVWSALTIDHQRAGRDVFGRLVDVAQGAPTRRRARLATFNDTETAMIETFGAARLLTFDRDAESREPTVELAHEALVRSWPRLRDWVEADADDLRVAARVETAATTWRDSGHDDGALLGGGPLDVATDLLDRRSELLAEDEQQFVERSVDREARHRTRTRRQNRFLRSALTGVAVLLAVSLVAGVFAVRQRDDARAEAFENESLRLLSSITDLASSDPSAALVLAAEAYRRSPGPETLGGLQRVLVASEEFLGWRAVGHAVVDVHWLNPERLLVVGPATVSVIDAWTADALVTWPLSDSDDALAHATTFHQATAQLGVALTDDSVVLWDADRPDSRSIWRSLPDVRALGFAPDGTALFVGDQTGAVHELHPGGTRPARSWPAHPNGSVPLPDGDLPEVIRRTIELVNDLGVQDLLVTDEHIVTTAGSQLSIWDRATLSELVGRSADVGADPYPVFVEVGRDPDRDDIVLFRGSQTSGTISLTDGAQEWRTDPSFARRNSPPQILRADFSDGLVHATTDDGFLRVLDPATGQLTRPPIELPVGIPGAVAVAPGGEVAAVGTGDGILLTSLVGRGLINDAVPLALGTGAVHVTERGEHVIVTSFDAGSTAIYDRGPDGSYLQRSIPVARQLGLISPILTGTGDSRSALEWRIGAGAGETRIIDLATLEGPADFVPDASRGLLTPDQTSYYVVPTVTEFELAPTLVGYHAVDSQPNGVTIPLPPGPLGSNGYEPLMFSSDGGLLHLRDGLGELVTVDIERRETVDPPFTPEIGIERMRSTSSGEVMYIVRSDGAIEERDARTWEVLRSVLGLESPVFEDFVSVYVDHDRDQWLSVAGKGARLVDPSTGQRIGERFPHDPSSVVTRGADGHDGAPMQLVTAVDDSVKIWNLETEEWFTIACQAAGRNLTGEEWDRIGPRDGAPRATCPQWPEPA